MQKNVLIIGLIIVVVLGIGVYFAQSNSSPKTDIHGEPMMSNQPVAQSHRSYSMTLLSNLDDVKPNQPTSVAFTIKNDLGNTLKGQDFAVVHEKKMHFIVVRKDLQYFQHLHTEDIKNNEDLISYMVTFPTDGVYRVFPDFTPDKSQDNPQLLPVTLYKDINVGDISKDVPQSVTLDTQTTKTVGDYQVTFQMPSILQKGQELTYGLSIQKNGQPVTDLQSYLGALGHSILLKEGSLDFIHAHAGESSGTMQGMNHAMAPSKGSGPNIQFTTTFPDSGIYKIFTQFQHQDKVQTVEYSIKVD